MDLNLDQSGDPESRTIPNQNSANQNSTSDVISRISTKMPPFSRNNPKLWFVQLESNFHTSGITKDDTQYHHVIASIETDVLLQVMDFVESPPTSNKYQALKEKILNIFELTSHERQKKLFVECYLGDKKPSQLLLEIKALAVKDFSDDMIKSLWLSRLPPSAQTVLAASSEPLNKLSVMADTICSLPSQAVNPANHDLPQMLNEMKVQIESLLNNVDNIKSERRVRNFGARFDKKKSSLCYYHLKFGDRAHKCEQPCSYKNPKNL